MMLLTMYELYQAQPRCIFEQHITMRRYTFISEPAECAYVKYLFGRSKPATVCIRLILNKENDY